MREERGERREKRGERRKERGEAELSTWDSYS
jgi:hypothetical protein